MKIKGAKKNAKNEKNKIKKYLCQSAGGGDHTLKLGQ